MEPWGIDVTTLELQTLALAEHLRWSITEIEAMPARERARWSAILDAKLRAKNAAQRARAAAAAASNK